VTKNLPPSFNTRQKAVKRKHRRYWQKPWFWIYIVALVCATMLVVFTWEIVREARNVLGFSRTVGVNISSMVVVKDEYHPPADSLLQPTQLAVVLEVAIKADQLEKRKATVTQKRKEFANVLNNATFSLNEYRWVRFKTAQVLQASDTTELGTLFRQLQHPGLQSHVLSRMIQNNLDSELLVPFK